MMYLNGSLQMAHEQKNSLWLPNSLYQKRLGNFPAHCDKPVQYITGTSIRIAFFIEDSGLNARHFSPMLHLVLHLFPWPVLWAWWRSTQRRLPSKIFGTESSPGRAWGLSHEWELTVEPYNLQPTATNDRSSISWNHPLYVATYRKNRMCVPWRMESVSPKYQGLKWNGFTGKVGISKNPDGKDPVLPELNMLNSFHR